GTRFEEERPLRQALRRNNFEWRKARQLWEYTGPPQGKDAAVAAVRSMVEQLQPQEAASAAEPAARPSYPPTAQQAAIIDACVSGQNVAVQALAGTGKTSTLRMVAAAMPDKRITYVAFNASIAREARQAFGGNVTAATAHSLALRSLRGGEYADKLQHIGKGA